MRNITKFIYFETFRNFLRNISVFLCFINSFEIFRLFKFADVLDIYKDRSLVSKIIDDKEIKKIGISWVIADDSSRDYNISFSSRIANWPSLTCAELDTI